MKVALAQLNYIVADFEYNSNKIISSIQKAKAQGADLILFSELAVCGYPPHDLLEKKEFVDQCIEYVQKIASHCNQISAIVGAPSLNNTDKGKKLYNSAYFLNNGKIEKIIHKTLLPTYDVFDEYRYFEPNTVFETVKFKEHNLAITICEDIWEKQPTANPFAQTQLYRSVPMEHLQKQNPDIIINIAASPFSYVQEDSRRMVLQQNTTKYNLPAFYVNQTGAHTELIFDGLSMVVDKNGNIAHRAKQFDEDFFIVDTQSIVGKPEIAQDQQDAHIPHIYNALIVGIKDYFGKMGFKTATLGLSGGIDSAVVCALAEKALGAQNVRGLLMPSEFSSDHSITDAIALAKNLGVQYDIIPIKNTFNSFCNDLSQVFENRPFNVAEENIQARIRGTLLMGISNKFGNILLNTTNKSEAAVGYGTLYGDMNGGLAILGDVYKTDIFKLANYINRNSEVIPQNSITKPPSAELRPNQKDSDSLPDYDTLDAILFNYIELNRSPQEIIALGFLQETVTKTIRMVNTNEYKRFQAPPILRVSSKAFGFGRRMPLVAKY